MPTKLAVRGIVYVPNHENGTPTTGQKCVAGYDVDNDLSDLGTRLYCLSFGTFASELSKSETTGHEPDDRVVVNGYDVSGQNTWKTCDLTTLGSSAVAVSATEIFSCAYVACNAWDGSTGQKYDAEYDVADDLTGAFSSDLSKGATEYFDSDFDSILVRTRSNTTRDRDLDKIVFQDVMIPSSCPAGPRNLITSPRQTADTISAAVNICVHTLAVLVLCIFCTCRAFRHLEVFLSRCPPCQVFMCTRVCLPQGPLSLCLRSFL